MFFIFFFSFLLEVTVQMREMCNVKKVCLIAWSSPSEAFDHLIFKGQRSNCSSSEATLIPWSAPKRTLIAWFNFDPGRKCFYMGHIRDYPLNVWTIKEPHPLIKRPRCYAMCSFCDLLVITWIWAPPPISLVPCKGASSWFWCVHACKNASSFVAVFCLALCGADVCSGVLLPRGYQHKAVCRPSR